MELNNQSAKIRDYAIAGFCLVFTILIVVFFLTIFTLWGFGETQVNIWSECGNGSANVFIGANENLRNVKCVALDKEFFANSEIIIGDLSKNDEDVCRFKLLRNTTEPLRFEVLYNNKLKREVCEWQHSSTYVD